VSHRPKRRGRPTGERGGPSEKNATSVYACDRILVGHEDTAWLRTATAALIAEARRAGLDPDATGPAAAVIIAPIGRSGVGDPVEDRSCDRCRKYTPPGRQFHPFVHQAAPALRVTGGLCGACARLEGWVG
jgi:hypothetical protein